MTRLTRRAAAAIVCAAAAAACRREARGQPVRPTPPNDIAATYGGVHPYEDPSPLRIIVGEGRGRRVLLGRDLHRPPHVLPRSARIVVPDTGELLLRVALVEPTGDTLAAVSYVLALSPDHSYGISVQVGGTAPDYPSICGGRFVAAPIRRPGAPGDSLYVSASGVPRGAIC